MGKRLWRRKEEAASSDSASPSSRFRGSDRNSLFLLRNRGLRRNGRQRRTSRTDGTGDTTTMELLPSHEQQPPPPPHRPDGGGGDDAVHRPHLTPENVAAVPPPGMSGPTQVCFAPESSRYVAFVSTATTNGGGSSGHHRSPPRRQSSSQGSASSYRPLTAAAAAAAAATTTTATTTEAANTSQSSPATPAPSSASTTGSSGASGSTERVLLCLDLEGDDRTPKPLLRWKSAVSRSRSKRRMLDSSHGSSGSVSLEERLRRERQRLSTAAGSLTQFSWTRCSSGRDDPSSTATPPSAGDFRLLVPVRGSLYIQNGILLTDIEKEDDAVGCTCIHDKTVTGQAAIDPQLSPDGSMVAWTADGELYVQAAAACPVKRDDEHTSSSSAQPAAAAVRLSFGAVQSESACISHGVAEFVAQEEMDRYRGFWWHPDSTAILFTRNDESAVPVYRIMHHAGGDVSSAASANASANHSSHGHSHGSSKSSSSTFEDHRYPFAGKTNPTVRLGLIQIDRESILNHSRTNAVPDETRGEDSMQVTTAQEIATEHWEACHWLDPPREASEYLARVHWLPDGRAVAQWQNRSQTASVLHLMNFQTNVGRTLLIERSDVWINLHHMFKVLKEPIHPDECFLGERSNGIPPMPRPLPPGSFSFLFASERTGYLHLYLYTYAPGINGEQAVLLGALTEGEWMAESIVGVDQERDVVYITGTFDSVLERHLYAVPLTNRRNAVTEDDDHVATAASQFVLGDDPNGSVRRGLSKVMHALSGGSGGARNHVNKEHDGSWAGSALRPTRLTAETGMHSVVMDDHCRHFVDTCSDINRPTFVKIFKLPRDEDDFHNSPTNGQPSPRIRLVMSLYDASEDSKTMASLNMAPESNALNLLKCLPPPELLSFPTTDGTVTLHAALYRPDPRIHGPGPYPLICAVYGGPHVQRVNRSWSQSADMRAQRLRSLGFCVVKCDNRGSSRRGLAFESSISRRLGRLEVLDQVAVVRQLIVRGIADPSRVGVYGWSYGGYLACMCLCRAPDVFHVAVAGAPVTGWDGYDTHYTERYMGLPADNPSGYRESAVFDHVPNMRGKLMIVHGLIDENVHFRHTSRLINKLIASGKDYDLLIFPEERHSPRRLRDRIYMEQRISDYFVRHLGVNTDPSALDLVTASLGQGGVPGLRPMAGRL